MCQTKCLFLFELWVRLISVLLKMYSLVKTFPLVLLHLPLQRIYFLNGITISLCQFTLFHWHGVCFTVSVSLCSVCLSFHFFFCLCPSFASLFKNLARNRDRRAPADFLTHSSFLKSKPTEAESGYYLSCVSPLSHSASFAQGL